MIRHLRISSGPLLLASSLALVACNQLEAIDDSEGSGGSEGGGGMPPEVRAAFEGSCGFSGCHGPGDNPPTLAGPALDGIVGGKAGGSDLPYVTLGDTAGSYIAIKMLPDPVIAALGATRTGARMPVGGPYDSDNVQTILAWIGGAEFPGGPELGGTTAEPETGGTTAAPEPTFAEVAAILETCSCHGGTPMPAVNGNLVFLPDIHAAIVDKPAQTAMLDLIEPGDPAASYLLMKLNGTYLEAPGGGGDPMPPGMALSDAQLATIEGWILAGAPAE